MAAKKKPARRKAEKAERRPTQPPDDTGEASTGRPSKYTQEIADAFCGLIADSMPARAALEKLGNPVAWTTVKRWLQENKEFRAQYARAREESADNDADEIRNIQRRVIGPLKAGETAIGHQEARLAIDTLKWLASKRAPKKYGSDLEIGDDAQLMVVVRKFAGERDSEKRGKE